MEKFIIYGPSKRVNGEVYISGAKNSVLGLLASSLLFEEPVVLSNVPFVKDVFTMIKLLKSLGSKVQINKKKNFLKIYNKKKLKSFVSYDLVKTMRAGVLAMGPLLGKLNKCKVALSGGCALGVRPINFHLKGFSKMGAKYKLNKGYVNISARRGLKGKVYNFPKITVTGTSNLIMSAVLSKGKTILKNIAIEPEIIDLINFLKKGGAKIYFLKKRTIKIIGVKSLKSVNHSVVGDRIEAFSYLCVAAITKGKLHVRNIDPKFLKKEIQILKKIGCKINSINNSIIIEGGKQIKPVNLKTSAYPGFATDNMPMLMSVLCIANGRSQIKETIFENRFMAVPELNRLSASIEVKNNKAYISGKKQLYAAQCISSDLRSTFSIILGCISAKGKSQVDRIYHGLRGYFEPENKLKKIGIKIKKIN